MRKVALFDMDGTLCDYHTVLLNDMRKLASPDEPPLQLNFHDRLDDHIQARKMMITSQPGWWAKLPRLDAGFLIYTYCQAIGYQIMILTKGPSTRDNAWSEKIQWCQRELGKDIEVTVTTDKSLVYGRVLVDDYPDYALSWLEYRPRGLVIMPKSVACEGFKHPNVIIYDGNNYREIADALKDAYERE